MNPQIKSKEFGLQELPIDSRDFSHSQTFGSLASNDLPTNDFLVAVPLELKNQDINYNSDFCTSYGASEAAENEDLVIFCPEWTFAYAKMLLGPSAWRDFGLNLRNICDAGISGGFLPRIKDPFKCDTVERPPRDFLANYINWPSELLSTAQNYKKDAYYSADGPHDTFDNYRSVMWINIKERRSILVGCLWRQSWSQSPGGLISETYEDGGSPHAFVFCGQKTINGSIYLIARLSDGPGTGDNGLFYFPRSVVNKEFSKFGAFTFKQKPPIIPTGSRGVLIQNLNIFNPLWIFKVISNLFKQS